MNGTSSNPVLPPSPSDASSSTVQWIQLALTAILYAYLILKEFTGRLHSSKCCGGSIEMDNPAASPATARASEAATTAKN